jgi:hypothetical protein
VITTFSFLSQFLSGRNEKKQKTKNKKQNTKQKLKESAFFFMI